MPIDAKLNEEFKALIAAGDYANAHARCEQALEQQPDDPDLMTLQATCQLELGHRARALALLKQAADADPQHAGSRFHLGRLLIAEDDVESAREHLTQCLVLDPNHAGARTILARLKAARGQLDDAMKGARTALRANPEHVPALVLMAELALEENDLEAAHEQITKAVRLSSTHPAAQMVLARVLEAQGHKDFARQSLENAVRSAPGAVALQVALAEFLERHGKWEAALTPLRAALELQPDRSELRVKLARALRRLRKLDQALAEYQWLLDDGTPPPALVIESAECLAQAGKGLEARSLIDREALTERTDARFLLARLDLADGQPDQARSMLQKLATESDAAIAENARLLLSQVALNQGDHHSALAALELDAEQGSLTPERLWKAAEIANQAGLVDQEERWLSALLEHSGTNEQLRKRARPRLADLCDRAGDYERAARLLQNSGWREPIGLAQDSEQIVDMALTAFDKDRASDQVDVKRPSPVVILGWPGSGREAVLAALEASDACLVLPLDHWPRRRETVLESLDKLDEGAADQATRRLISRRYFRGLDNAPELARRSVESGVVFAPELIALKRVFPEAVIIRMRANADDLGIYWQLAGFADVESMKAAFEQDQAQLDRLLAAWGERVIEFDMSSWVPLSSEGVEQLSSALDIKPDSAMETAARSVVEPAGLRAAGHSEHYRAD